jgi:hypothetical protein
MLFSQLVWKTELIPLLTTSAAVDEEEPPQKRDMLNEWGQPAQCPGTTGI